MTDGTGDGIGGMGGGVGGMDGAGRAHGVRQVTGGGQRGNGYDAAIGGGTGGRGGWGGTRGTAGAGRRARHRASVGPAGSIGSYRDGQGRTGHG
ncbi:hypothetical protein K4B79_10755 [Streptomyces lincolnensis]|uniref:hypothetical protein n=1 Tax=Streptomyces lincolnensis TaxID=1915 RepID=UPI001E63BD88|nr:hypothetical protein [Streptomyces lincolnensis]MCD7438700.1 hypothetical protein [Streptomyces lincolnensis]